MYATNYSTVFIVVSFAIVLWTAMGMIFRKDNLRLSIGRLVNTGGTAIAFYGIFFYTVLNRTASNTHTFVFVNEYSPEFYREMVMNAFLYFPFGLTLSTLIGPVSILIAFILSLTIESWQYITGSGVAQGTDVIMNTLGCAIGAVPWILVRFGVAEKAVAWVIQRMKR